MAPLPKPTFERTNLPTKHPQIGILYVGGFVNLHPMPSSHITYTLVNNRSLLGTLVNDPSVPEDQIWVYDSSKDRVVRYQIVRDDDGLKPSK